MEGAAAVGREAAPAHDFFARARARLSLDVPLALTDPTVPATRGDLDLDPADWERAGVSATRPAAVLIPVIDRPEPAVLLTLRTTALRESCRADRISRRQDRRGRFQSACCRAARGRGGDRPRTRAHPSDRLSRSLSDLQRISHPAGGGARRSGLWAQAQSQRGRRCVRSAARLPDGCPEPCAAQSRLEGHRAPLLRHAVR